MLTEDLLLKMGDNMEMILDQLKEAEPGSKEQLQLAQIFKELNAVQIENENIEIEFNKAEAAEIEAAKKREADEKEKNWKHKADILGIVVPAGTALLGLGAVLLFEVKDVITSKAGMRWLGKLFK